MSDLPAPVADRFAEALARYQAGDAAAAATGFAAVLGAAPDHADALRLHGLALIRAGEPQPGRALRFLARARRLAWTEPLAHLHHGIGLLEAGQPARAAAVLRRAAMLAPDDPSVWINFAAALLALDKAPAARAAARRATARAPEMAEAHYMLGLTELAAGAPGPARIAFGQAITRRRDFAGAWLNLGLAAYRQGDMAAAVGAMRGALEADPANSAAEANLAAFQLLAGDTEEVLARLRAVLARDPGCVPARLNLANALLLEREPGEVLTLLMGAPPPGREGRHWRAHRALALIELGRWEAGRAEVDAITEPYGDAEILVLWRRIAFAARDGDEALAATLAARMAKAADAEDASLPEHRIIGHFDLARFHHRRGRIETAFAHWTSGHRLLGRSQKFSRERLRQFVDATIARFDAARMAGARAGNEDPAPVFIVGLPRSGTTLAEQILAAHPACFGAGERPAAHRLIARLAEGAETAASVDRLAALDARTLDHEAAAYLAELRALAPDAARVVDKMPANARHLGFLATLLPGARFIHCRRDPRDIGLSIFQLRFFGYHPYAHDLSDLGFAIGEHARLMAHWRAVLGDRLIDVDLTDWIGDFPATLGRVLAFLDLPYDAACERFHEQTTRVRTASADQVRRPVNRAGIGRFRAYAEHLEPLFAELDRAGLVTWTAEDARARASRQG